MAINKVVFDGEVLIDLTEDTVTASVLRKGYLAHDKAGNVIVGIWDEEESGDEIDRILNYGFVGGVRSFSDDGSIISTDVFGRKLTRTFSDDGQTCTSVLTDESDGELGRMTKTYNDDFSEVTVTDYKGNVTVRKITVSASGTSTEVTEA